MLKKQNKTNKQKTKGKCNLHLREGLTPPASQRREPSEVGWCKIQWKDCPDICTGGFVLDELQDGSSTLLYSYLKSTQTIVHCQLEINLSQCFTFGTTKSIWHVKNTTRHRYSLGSFKCSYDVCKDVTSNLHIYGSSCSSNKLGLRITVNSHVLHIGHYSMSMDKTWKNSCIFNSATLRF